MPILTDQERIGTLLGERYRVEAILGRGGMGVVFRAREEDTGQAVAVKILRPELAQSDPQFAKRFLREARAAAAIRHPNVVEVMDLGEEPDGTIYQVLQLLVGASLREHLERKEKLDLHTTLELLLPVMNALEAAHALGIVHRDLKPDNLFLARQDSGEVKPTLLDFGIAKLLDTRGGSFATNTGSILGTPAYMAPEQAGGYKNQGAAIDVWAMGIIAFECLSGSPPFSGSSPAHVMLKIMTETPPPIDTVVPDVPAAVSRVIERALARTPAERHASMAAFREALREAAAAAGVELPAQGRSSTTRVLSIAPPPDEDDVARAATDAAGSPHDDGSEGVATMAARLRQDRQDRLRADAATQVAAAKRASDSIEVAIEAPVASSRRLALIAATVATILLGVGIGAALFGGGEPTSTSPPATTVATSPPPTLVTTAGTTIAPPPSTLETSTPPGTTTTEVGLEPPIAPPATLVRGPRGGRGPREGGTSMATTMADETPTMVTTMDTTTTMMGGLPSVVGWEDE